ncbi:MAG: 2Fe-2S iron-sulfur cluster-binding protein [candidate division KSB1 bacterium]|nr:2Fe-2S iron-sulfur cluster-binding protein [candidate division KSB1 bacterium]
MPILTIDGKTIEVEKGTTILQAAQRLGIDIPHYCYHPGLRIAGSCRMCLVEIQGVPKLQIACYTEATDGMVVFTQSEKVQQARRAVLEFLLVDHPLDCPVCDQAGECYLQIYYMQHGLHPSRVREDKLKRAKVRVLGEHIVLDQERCILCSRCVRFTEEVTRTFELGIFNRGDRSVVDVYPGEQLRNRYQGNLADICPVGALTDRQFRFRTRVWYLDQAKSICPGCSRGCNIVVDFNVRRGYKAGGRRIPRIRPRPNPWVNQYWMCDDGRYGFGWVEGLDRILSPKLLENGHPREIPWAEAIRLAGAWIGEAAREKKLGVLLSPRMSNEEIYAASYVLRSLGVGNVGYWAEPATPGDEDDLLIKADKNPNTYGARLITGVPQEDHLARMVEALSSGAVDTVLIFLHNLEQARAGRAALETLRRAKRFVFVGTNWNRTAAAASLVLPVTAFTEQEGTFTNFQGRVQRFWQAVEPMGQARSALSVLNELAASWGIPPLPDNAAEAFARLASENRAFAGLSYETLGDQGQTVRASEEPGVVGP